MRGYRIELGEIESEISEVSGVKDCVVVAPQSEEEAQTLSAYIVPIFAKNKTQKALDACVFQPNGQSEETELIEKIKERLTSKLPDFMVPSSFMLLEKMPLTPNGKIDRKMLPKPEKVKRAAEATYQAPSNEIEEAIAVVWQDMLNIEKVGVTDNFFDLGANSLLMVQANNRLNQKLDQKVSLVRMFRYPTVASLAAHLSGESNESASLDKASSRGAQRKKALGARNKRLARKKSA